MSQAESDSFMLPRLRFVLASASPRRAEILRVVNWRFEICAANVDESRFENEDAIAYAERLALAKAVAVARTLKDNQSCIVDDDEAVMILGADTIVLIDELILGKPVNREDARAMLRLLSGRRHEVVTAVALVDAASGKSIVGHERTSVYFADLSDAEIAAYAATDEPHDKAGAYAVQGLASLFIERIEGDYWNVVGLPVRLVYRLVREFRV